jgi:hypothetical protein
MRDFLEQNNTLVVGLAVGGTVLAIILGILLYGARELQVETLKRIDQPAVGAVELPGPKNQISDRSKKQVDTLLDETPHIVGGWVTKLQYGKTENPIIHFWTESDTVKDLIIEFGEIQESGRGSSSAELNAASEQSLRNSEEAKSGLIKCGPLSATNLLQIAPSIVNVAKGVCRATIPPFDENVNLGVVVLIDVDPNDNNADIQAIRRTLLQLQIDVFNRDYQGRETWARAIE